jgi:hypothetical protein
MKINANKPKGRNEKKRKKLRKITKASRKRNRKK